MRVACVIKWKGIMNAKVRLQKRRRDGMGAAGIGVIYSESVGSIPALLGSSCYLSPSTT